MNYVEDTIEEIQPDGTIILRRVIIPVQQSRAAVITPVEYDVPESIVPMGDDPGEQFS